MEYLFEGAIACKAAILAQNREVYEILIDSKRKDRDCAFIKRIATQNNIPITLLSREEIDALASKTTHGGILCKCGERRYQTLEEIIQPNGFTVILEGIEDPYNFAYILRSLYALGCNGVIVPERNWTTASDVIAKGSAGASEYIPIVSVSDMGEAIATLKQNGIKLLGAMRSDVAIPLYEADLTGSICIAIGGEMRGLSKVVENEVDTQVYIPYEGDFRNALTAASSGAILAYEVARQRMNTK